MEQVISLMRKTGLRLLSVKDGKVDLGAGALIPRFLTWRAEAESMRISQRVKSANRKLAREGKAHPGGMRPFGHERGCHALRQEEAAVIREAAERLIAGESLYAISMDWRARGIKTATGKEWTGANLRKTLSKPRLAGYRERDGELFRGEGGIVRILDDSVWEQVKTILADPARTRPEVRVARHLLTNLVCCGRCGQRMVAGTDRGRRVYICQPSSHPGACGRMSCSAERAEEAIAEIWIAAFDSPDAVDSVSERVRAAAEAQDRLRDLRDRLAALTTAHFVEGVIDRPQYMDAKRELEARIADIEGEERRRERTKRIAALQGNSQAVWERASLSERRALLALVVARIAILPRGKQVARFDPTRMAIEWRA